MWVLQGATFSYLKPNSLLNFEAIQFFSFCVVLDVKAKKIYALPLLRFFNVKFLKKDLF